MLSRKANAIAMAFLGSVGLSACGSHGVGGASPSSSPATFTASATALTFASQTTGTTSTAQSVTLNYSGGSSLTNVVISTSGDYAQSNTCGTSLMTTATCSISVTFNPTAAGNRAGTLTIASSYSGGDMSVALSGTGAAPVATTPAASASPASLSFTSQTVGSVSTSQVVTLQNTGSAPLNNIALSIAGDFSQSNTCATALAVAASCAITVSFSPTAAGSRTGAVTIASDSSSGSLSVALSGTGAAAVSSSPVAAASPASLSFSSQAVGTLSTSQVVTLKNTGTAPLSGIAVSITGDFVQSNGCGTTLAASASCSVTVSFSPSASGARTGAVSIASNASGSPATVSLSGTGAGAPASVPGAMSLISRGLPIYASSAQYPATYANDGDYNTNWRSVGVPATLALDLSSVPMAQRQQIWLVWYNDNTYGYDHPLINQPGYNNAAAYTIEVNAAAGGGAAPTAGWVQVKSLSGNTLHSYSYLLNFAGYQWIRMNFTAVDGSAGNTDIAVNLDVYSAPNGVTDGWFFNGDSITANCMGHTDVGGPDANNPGGTINIASPSFGQQVNAIVGNNIPAQENGGIPEFKSGDMLPYLAGWLSNVPSKYVTINLGTNDSGATTPSTYYSNMEQLVQAVIAVGKTPIIPTIPFSVDAGHQAGEPALNAQLQALAAAYPAIIRGPDLYAYFKANPQNIAPDGIHPNAQGCVAYRAMWAQFAATTIYGH